MDSEAAFSANIDTFSNTFSSEQYVKNFGFDPLDFPPNSVISLPPPPRQFDSSNLSPTTTNPNNNRTSPTSASSANPISPTLNPRSCTTCRRRKVRCDKRHPCSNCHKAGIECVFPRPGRAPRRTKKPPDSELLARLRRLEGVVQSLGKDVDGTDLSPEKEAFVKERQLNGVARAADLPIAPGPATAAVAAVAAEAHGHGKACPKVDHSKPEETGIEKQMGRLVVDEGRSRYVTNSFWSTLTYEIAEMKDILDDPTDEEDDYPSPESNSTTSTKPQSHQMFIFGYSSTIVHLRILYPPLNQFPLYWKIYLENVDPLIRILHRGMTDKLIKATTENLENVSKGTEALMFAIFFSVVTSLSPEDCQAILSIDKDIGLRRFRFACEQALAKAGFLDTQEMTVLQAFALFLVTVRRHDDSRFVWTMVGLLIRIATSLGLHRDGEQFGLAPYDTEMRRRVWWQVCVIDIRASEDQGTDPSITEQLFDTKFPLNVNDEDIWPETKEPPPEREGYTDMTFDLIRYNIGRTIRRLTYVPPGLSNCAKAKKHLGTMEEKEQKIEDLRQFLEEKYLQYCDMSNPLHWVAANVARLVMAKMWLIIHHPFQREGDALSKETKDRVFLTSIDVIRYSRILETQQKTVKWGWLFRTYVQWHAVAFLLSELCSRTLGPDVDEAWEILDAVFEEWGGTVSAHKKGMLWKPIRRLMARAKTARAKALELQRLAPPSRNPSIDITTPRLPRLSMPVQGGFAEFRPIPFPESEEVSGVAEARVELPFQIPTPGSSGLEDVGQWLAVDGTLLDDPLMGDDHMDWAGFDDMVKDFQMEVQPEGPVQFSMGSWW